ncbi:MAG: hypothetical protein HZA66_17115 [Rhodopseudomonas palustris]|uniref:Invasion associated locus B family protein n=1 Tax=Rhodopseudomonas palustris TaxID=1076 RepID=A0A933VVN9_RHOPL|nr:hypothetical protein [Rhodopseudomonas palustris]
MNRHRLVTGLIFGLAVAGSPPNASAQQFTTKKYAEAGGWTIQVHAADGQFMRCGAVVPGGKVSFEISSEGWTLSLPTAKPAPADEVKGALEIDGKSVKAAYLGGDEGRLMTFLKPAQLKQIRAAKTLTATAGQEQTPGPLAGIDAALRKAGECNDKGGG